MRLRGILSGALALIVLEVLVTSSQASGRAAGFFAGVSHITNWFLSPGVPGIPDRTHPGSSPSVLPTDTASQPQIVLTSTPVFVGSAAYSN